MAPDISADPSQPLRDFKPQTPFFVGFDSDGCVFDSMEIKHKECFAPMFIKHFRLQAASKYARETWEFVNLYSKTRGINRFPALARSLHLVAQRPEVQARKVQVPGSASLDSWIAHETRLSNSTLSSQVRNGNEALRPVLAWSEAVNASIEDVVFGVPPFPLVRESLEKLKGRADVMVISQTPAEALEREWAEHNISGAVRLIAGQELGTKTEHLKFAAAQKYPAEKILMIGDAPGDYQAAQANGALFYPIIPGQEELSWRQFHDEALEMFLAGRFQGGYASELLRKFQASLPENPPWKT